MIEQTRSYGAMHKLNHEGIEIKFCTIDSRPHLVLFHTEPSTCLDTKQALAFADTILSWVKAVEGDSCTKH